MQCSVDVKIVHLRKTALQKKMPVNATHDTIQRARKCNLKVRDIGTDVSKRPT